MLGRLEVDHHVRQLLLAHLAVADGDACFGHEPADPLGGLLDGSHPVVDVKHLASTLQLTGDRLTDQLVVVGRDVRLDRLAFLWRSLDHAHVTNPTDGHVQRSRYGGCGE